MVVVSILSILAAIIIPVITGEHTATSSDTVSWGTNGQVATRCISGFKMVVGSSGSVQQITDAVGYGIPCTQ